MAKVIGVVKESSHNNIRCSVMCTPVLGGTYNVLILTAAQVVC